MVFAALSLCRRPFMSVKGRFIYSSSNIAQVEAGKVLYLNCSGSNEWSYTGKTARDFIKSYKTLNPCHTIQEVNLWDETLLRFNLSYLESKMRISSGEGGLEDQQKMLAVKEMAETLIKASKLIISCPMWNFSVPYVLKQYIDCVVQRDLTFKETDSGQEGLITGRPLLLVTSSSDDFTKDPMKQHDFQVPYLKTVFGFIGFQDFRHIYIAGVKHRERQELLEYAQQRIDEEVVRF